MYGKGNWWEGVNADGAVEEKSRDVNENMMGLRLFEGKQSSLALQFGGK